MDKVYGTSAEAEEVAVVSWAGVDRGQWVEVAGDKVYGT